MTTNFTTMASPIGELTIASDGAAITGIYMETHRHGPVEREHWVRANDDAVLRLAVEQLGEYFAGDRIAFELPLHAEGTPFQQTVWNELCKIRYGTTISYGDLAKRVGNAAASRAVGLANGRNPISIVVPCHRVIGANGSLTGYGGGLERKKALLAHEQGLLRF